MEPVKRKLKRANLVKNQIQQQIFGNLSIFEIQSEKKV